MDLKTSGSLFTLTRRLFDKAVSTEPMVDASPALPLFDELPPSCQLERCLPEDVGVSSDRVYEFLCALEDDYSLDMHNIMLIRHGKIISECGMHGYSPSLWHTAYSESKTICMLAVGMLCDEGRLTLDTRIVDIFKGRGNLLTPLTHKSITVRHLLSMTSGVQFGELGAVTERDWVKCWLESQPAFEAGTKFFYNSMNSYMLSAAVKAITGLGLLEYLKPRLFEPLGIGKVYWEKCPMGIEKGGWGLFITAEDIAKIGLLILNGGVYGGRRLISRKWLCEALTVQSKVPCEYGDFDYGYHIWLSRRPGVYLINGMFGQNVLCDTTSDTVCVTNAGNCELFQQSRFFELYDKYIRGDNEKSRARYGDYTDGAMDAAPIALSDRLALIAESTADRLKRIVNNVNEVNKYTDYSGMSYEQRRLRAHENRLCEYGETHISSPANASQSFGETRRSLRALEYNFEMLDRKVYVTDPAEAAAVGIVPLYIQIMSNRYSGGITDLGFKHTRAAGGGRLALVVREGGETVGLKIGFDRYEHSEITLGGVSYKIAVKGKFSYDDEGNTVLRIRVSFIEYASTRYIRFCFSRGGKVTVRLSENPGRDYVETILRDSLSSLNKSKGDHPFIDAAMTQLDDGYISYRLEKLLAPEFEIKKKTKEKT